MSRRQADERHAAAIEHGEDGYVDPDTGLFVLTEKYLASRPCCGNGCRHCPHGRVTEEFGDIS